MPTFTTRPVLMATHGMVTSTHYLASEAGLSVLKRGGNVVDAGAAMWFCLTVLEPHRVGLAGESPILIYMIDQEKVFAINGQGPAPAAATIEWFQNHGYALIPPDGFLPAVVPSAFDAWVKALANFGTMTLGEVLGPAIDLAACGFPVYPALWQSLNRPLAELANGIRNLENAGFNKISTLEKRLISTEERFIKEWPSSADIYLPNGRLPNVGEVITNHDWAHTLRKVVEVEKTARPKRRLDGLEAARDYFYRGPIAEKIVGFTQTFECQDVYGQKHKGFLALEDLADYETRIEEAVSVEYHGLDVHKCGPWTQGPVFLQQLRLFEGFDLVEMGHNSAEYLHTLIECAKLAFADREKYYADPEFVDVPLVKLLSKKYADERRKLIDQNHASTELVGGDVPRERRGSNNIGWPEGDTVHLEAMDKLGNMISATASGGWITASPIIPSLGFCLSTRAQMFHLDPNHVERLEPQKRPSTTLTPSLVTREGESCLTFGTPGGDQQDQWTMQFFLNHIEFGLDIQDSLDQPTIHTTHFPGSFWPHAANPGVVHVEPRIPMKIVRQLQKKGHRIVKDEPWSHGRCLAIRYDPETQVISGGASPRTMKAYAIGW